MTRVDKFFGGCCVLLFFPVVLLLSLREDGIAVHAALKMVGVAFLISLFVSLVFRLAEGYRFVVHHFSNRFSEGGEATEGDPRREREERNSEDHFPIWWVATLLVGAGLAKLTGLMTLWGIAFVLAPIVELFLVSMIRRHRATSSHRKT